MVPLLLTEPDLLVLAHHPLGASTGYMGDLRGDWPAQVGQARELSPFAIELSVLSEGEIDGLASYLADDPPLPFRYLSIHGPSKGRVMSEPALVDVLLELSAHAQAVVMHPDTMEDPAPYRSLGRKLVLENMDAGKHDGCTVDGLSRWFDVLPEAGFCFDIAHAWSVDDTMAAGIELLDAFRTRLRHLHVSSLSPDLHHVPLTEEHEELFTPLLQRCLDVLWILEAPPRHS
jgi:Xylose isomerase-like TIM barrel